MHLKTDTINTTEPTELVFNPNGLVSGVGGQIVRELGPATYWTNGLPQLRELVLTDEEIEKSQSPALAM